MVNVNRVLFGGYLTADPETKQVGNGTVCKFALANNRKWTDRSGQAKEEATFVDCEAWAKVGEIAQTYLRKGRPVLIEGRLKLDRWKTDQGEARQRLKINVEAIQFLDGPADGQEQAAGSAQAPQQTGAPVYEPEPF